MGPIEFSFAARCCTGKWTAGARAYWHRGFLSSHRCDGGIGSFESTAFDASKNALWTIRTRERERVGGDGVASELLMSGLIASKRANHILIIEMIKERMSFCKVFTGRGGGSSGVEYGSAVSLDGEGS